MGQRVLQPIVNQQVSNVLGALDRQVTQAAGGSGGGGGEGETRPAPAGEGAAGAESGIHAGSPEAYSSDPEGPTQSTEN